ncbi:0f4fbff0-c293-46ef-9f68-ee7149042d47 [Sclerotinia trifoliorum]|uniref:0f4fbff0-c293-46ef-9f68-ee7149042d47 n=1 Tax=Sclerotinia trifoliorum TaxID=28548 RepID=A0A8H2ZWY2_9HELO|nr:0f4fbff0-c293-46ef-9f68-ee7149042d47 [Sclerotinia trifoliorum]
MSPLSLPSARDGPVSWSTTTDEPYYTDDDLLILHDIVVRAQHILPTLLPRDRLPTNALFRSYYEILPRVGIDTDHDNRYARILFKIGALRDFNGTLFEKFEEVLSQRGITLEFDTDRHEYLRSSKATSPDVADYKESDTLYNDENELPLPRRNSETGVLDMENAAQAQAQALEPKHKRNKSFSPLPLGPATPAKMNELKSFISEATRAVSPEPLPEPTPQPPRTTQRGREERGVNNVRNWLEASEYDPPRRHGRSVSTHGSIRSINRHPEKGAQRGRPSGRIPLHKVTNEHQDTSDELTTTSEAEEQYDSNDVVETKVSVGWMEERADVVSKHYFEEFIIKKLYAWRDQAKASLARKAHLDAIASKHDNHALQDQAFSTWLEMTREKMEMKRQVQEAREVAERAQQAHLEAQQKLREVEERYAKLERRVEKARDRHLKHKAFTHWAAITREKVEITEVAQRQILRSRMFTAWKTQTEENEKKNKENEEKARKFQLRKFFGKLKAKKEEIDEKSNMAAQVSKGNLLGRVFSKMAQEKKVVEFTQRIDEKNKQRALSTWVGKAQAVSEATQLAEDERLLNVVTKSMDSWKEKTETQVVLNDRAERAAKAKQLGSAFKKWRLEAQTAPAEKKVVASHNVSLLKGSLSIWKLRAEQEKQATAIDHDKIVREAFTEWRHQTRLKRLRAISDDRAVAKASKTWRLETKCAVLQREKKEETKSACLEVWFDRSQDTRSRRWEREEIARRHDNKTVAASVLRRWYVKMNDRAEIEAQASDFQAPRILGQCLDSMRAQLQRIVKLNKVARAANKFFVMRSALNKWREATQKSKREKRKTAYIQVRRNRKLYLAADMFSRWRQKAQEKMALNERARQFAQGKTFIIGMNSFDRWRARTEEVAELEPLWKEMVMRKFFNRWKDRTESLQVLNIEATLDFQERRQSDALRKWSLRTIQARAMANTAKEVHDKNTRKGHRKMFNYWRQRTAQQRPFVDINSPPGTDTAENWSDFGEEVDMDEITKRLYEKDPPRRTTVPIKPPLNPVTPKPGYMATPSRRSQRVLAASARFHSTTPRAPLTTPLERELRKGIYGSSMPFSKRGRSTLGMDRGFPDIPEG